MEKVNSYYLNCRYDSRASFYKKAKVETITSENEEIIKLYSYGTLVATIIKVNNTITYHYFGQYSQTTTRHQKEFFKQYGLTDNEIKKLFKDETLIKEEI